MKFKLLKIERFYQVMETNRSFFGKISCSMVSYIKFAGVEHTIRFECAKYPEFRTISVGDVFAFYNGNVQLYCMNLNKRSMMRIDPVYDNRKEWIYTNANKPELKKTVMKKDVLKWRVKCVSKDIEVIDGESLLVVYVSFHNGLSLRFVAKGDPDATTWQPGDEILLKN